MSFYTEMAEMAREMLAEYGMAVVLTRETGDFDEVAGAYDSEPQALNSTGLFTSITEQLKQDFTVIDGDRTMILDDSVEPQNADTVAIDGADWSVVKVKPIKPTDTIICYFVQVRK